MPGTSPPLGAHRPSTALWSHLLSNNTKTASQTINPYISDRPAPIAPIDKSGTSMRLILHDTQAHLERFSNKVDGLLGGLDGAKVEVRNVAKECASGWEKAEADWVQLVNRCQKEIQKTLGTPAQASVLSDVHSSLARTDRRVEALDKRIDVLHLTVQTQSQTLKTIQDQQTQILTAVAALTPVVHSSAQALHDHTALLRTLQDQQTQTFSSVAGLTPLIQSVPLQVGLAKAAICESVRQYAERDRDLWFRRAMASRHASDSPGSSVELSPRKRARRTSHHSSSSSDRPRPTKAPRIEEPSSDIREGLSTPTPSATSHVSQRQPLSELNRTSSRPPSVRERIPAQATLDSSPGAPSRTSFLPFTEAASTRPEFPARRPSVRSASPFGLNSSSNQTVSSPVPNAPSPIAQAPTTASSPLSAPPSSREGQDAPNKITLRIPPRPSSGLHHVPLSHGSSVARYATPAPREHSRYSSKEMFSPHFATLAMAASHASHQRRLRPRPAPSRASAENAAPAYMGPSHNRVTRAQTAKAPHASSPAFLPSGIFGTPQAAGKLQVAEQSHGDVLQPKPLSIRDLRTNAVSVPTEKRFIPLYDEDDTEEEEDETQDEIVVD